MKRTFLGTAMGHGIDNRVNAVDSLVTLNHSKAKQRKVSLSCVGVTTDVNYFSGCDFVLVSNDFSLVRGVWRSVNCTGSYMHSVILPTVLV